MRGLSLTLIVAASISVACGGRQSTAEKLEEARGAAAKAAIAALVSRHGADDQWQEVFKATERFGVYTYELQKALIRSDARPVVLVGSVDDVISLGIDQYEIRGRQFLDTGPTLYFSLRCGADQLSSILNRTPEILDVLAKYGIVARITRLTKPMFKGSAEMGTDDEIHLPEITIEPSDVVIAAGTCLEVTRLDDERPPNKRMEPTRR